MILRFMSSRDKFSSKLWSSLSLFEMTSVASRECARCCFSKINETTKARALEREERSFRRSTSIRSNCEFSENSWRSRSLNCKCFDVFWLIALIFLNRRFEAIDRARYWWECLRCLHSSFQTLSRRHHNRFSSLCEEKISRRRSKSCLVEDRIRFEFRWDEEEEREKEEREKKEKRKKKKKKKKEENDDVDDVVVRIVQIAVNKQLQVQIFVIIDKKSSFRRFVKK